MDSTGGDLSHTTIEVDKEYQEKGTSAASLRDETRDNVAAAKYEHEIQSSGSSSTDEVALDKLDSQVVTVKDAKDGDEAYAHLPPHEREIIKRQVDLLPIKANYGTLYRYATRNDIIIVAISSFCAIIGGAVMPLMTVMAFSIESWGYWLTGVDYLWSARRNLSRLRKRYPLHRWIQFRC